MSAKHTPALYDDDPGTDRDCICEDAEKGLYNPDCYWHGTEGKLLEEAEGE